MKKILITRPEGEAEKLAALLTKRGWSCLIEPILHIEILPEAETALKTAFALAPQAVIVTSKRGVEALAALTAHRNTPLLAVGAATANYAQNLGFSLLNHGETVQALMEFAEKTCNPLASLLYARGEDISTDIAGLLQEKGFGVHSAILYRAVASQEFSMPLRSAITDGSLTAVMFFSRRTVAIYAQLAQKHGFSENHHSMSAVCMSEAVAQQARALPWRFIGIARDPDMQHMLEAAAKFL